MQFVPLAGGVDLALLTEMATKVGQYVIVITDVVNEGRRIVSDIYHTFRKMRKAFELLGAGQHATAYCHTGQVELASAWQGVIWKKNPVFNGQ